jgi:hypothetical protein
MGRVTGLRPASINPPAGSKNDCYFLRSQIAELLTPVDHGEPDVPAKI